MKLIILLSILVALTLACAGEARRDESGRIVTGGQVRPSELRAGDCFQDWDEPASGDAGRVSRLEAVPCEEPHDNEVFHVLDVSERGEWPGDDSLESFSSATCLDWFEAYVQREHARSRLDYGYIRPSAESWQGGARRIVCFLFDSMLPPLVGSARGSEQ